MNCLMISPKHGAIRISRFAVGNQPGLRPHANSNNKVEHSRLDRLDERCIAPLRLSEALQNRLNRGAYLRGGLEKIRRN